MGGGMEMRSESSEGNPHCARTSTGTAMRILSLITFISYCLSGDASVAVPGMIVIGYSILLILLTIVVLFMISILHLYLTVNTFCISTSISFPIPTLPSHHHFTTKLHLHLHLHPPLHTTTSFTPPPNSTMKFPSASKIHKPSSSATRRRARTTAARARIEVGENSGTPFVVYPYAAAVQSNLELQRARSGVAAAGAQVSGSADPNELPIDTSGQAPAAKSTGEVADRVTQAMVSCALFSFLGMGWEDGG